MAVSREDPRRTERVDFFVSYNKADKEWAEWITWTLEAAGYTCRFQGWDFRPGNNFVLEVQAAARIADRVIAVLSPDYVVAPHPAPEWASAFVRDPDGMRRRLVPVMVRPCAPEGLLTSIVHISLVGLDRAKAATELLAGVADGRAKPPVPPRFPGPATAAEDLAPLPAPSVPELIEWTPLATVASVVWRRDGLVGLREPASTPVLEVHLVPVPASRRQPGSALPALGDALVALGRAHGLFTRTQAVDVRHDDERVIAADGVRDTGVGLSVTTAGQRGGWVALPHDAVGAVLDEVDAATTIAGLLRALAEVDLPRPDRVAPAVGLAPTEGLALGSAADVGNRTGAPTAKLDTAHLRWPADEWLTRTDLERDPNRIAAALAARLVAAYRVSTAG